MEQLPLIDVGSGGLWVPEIAETGGRHRGRRVPPDPPGLPPGGGRAGSPKRRKAYALYLLVRPDQTARDQAGRLTALLREQHGFTAPRIKPEILHVTAQGLYECDDVPEELARLRDVERMVLAMMRNFACPSFDVMFNQVMSFNHRGKRPLVLTGCGDGTARLHALFAMLGELMWDARLAQPTRGAARPHMTLLWDIRQLPTQPVEPIGWRVRELELVLSHVGKTMHESRGKWALH